jgi:uncharacterized membrane protein YgdD (TMEM256/DUF423 family)
MFSQKVTLILGSVFGLLGVAIGAFGAHALKPLLQANNKVDTFELAVRYQFYHAFALLFIGVLMNLWPAETYLQRASLFVTLGILLFSGSLYALSFNVGKAVAFITPIGGVFFIVGWLFLMLSFLKMK